MGANTRDAKALAGLIRARKRNPSGSLLVKSRGTDAAPAVVGDLYFEAGALALTQASRLDNSQTFYAATVSPGAVTLTPSLYSSGQTFYAATVSQAGGAQSLTPARFDNSAGFYGHTVVPGAVTLTPVRVDGSQTFYAATLTAGPVNLSPGRLDGTQAFYGHAVSLGAGDQTLTAGRFDGSSAFYAAVVQTTTYISQTSRLDNASTVYAPSASAAYLLSAPRVDGGESFPAHAVTVGPVAISAPLLVNDAQFFAPLVYREGDEPQFAGGGSMSAWRMAAARRKRLKRDDEEMLLLEAA